MVFEHSCKLAKKGLSKPLPCILLSNFDKYKHDKIPFEKKIVGVRDVFSISFKGYSQDG